MKAVKENKVYTISETEMNGYLDRGFDVVLDNGTVERSRQAAVSAEEYAELQAENAKLKAENAKLRAENKKLKEAK